MMIAIRHAQDRGAANFGWLESRHTFSFGQYYDPKHMGFASLRAINEDKVQPAQGFGPHGHQDMEIITYVLEGALQHQDSLGNGSVIRPGDVQRMSAGTGIQPSAFNASNREPVHFLQIWILPDEKGLPPSYEQKTFAAAHKRGRLQRVGARNGREGAISIHQDVDLYSTLLNNGKTVTHSLVQGHYAWVQVARGKVLLNGQPLQAGDGAALSQAVNSQEIALQGVSDGAEVLLFDMQTA